MRLRAPALHHGAEFAKRLVTQVADGQSGPAYDELLLQQQAAVSKATYENCRDQQAGAFPQITGIKVVTTYPEDAPVPGAGDLASTAVTLKITVEGGTSETQTMHAFAVEGSWRWSLDQPTFSAESRGTCNGA
jgi:hypothetical protein